MSAQSKQVLRKVYSAKRGAISASDRQKAAEAAARHWVVEIHFQSSQHIACYLPFRDELDSLPLLQAIWESNKICYLPVLTVEKKLHFVRYNKGDKLIPNQYSILEPENKSRLLAAENLDIVITPLVVFDEKGHRLGTGGGYYDRTFAFRQQQSICPPFLLGLAYALQKTEAIPVDPWDINLDAVLTEQGCHFFKQ